MTDFQKDILSQINNTWEKQIDIRYIDRDFNLNTTTREKALRQVFELIEDGELILVDKNKYVTLEKSGFLKGTISGNRKGFAFLKIKGQADDLFILARDLNGAADGDLVLAKEKELQNKKAAIVYKILKRKNNTIVGSFKKVQGGGFVTPDNDKLSFDVFVNAQNSKNAQDGEKVYLKITDYSGERGKVEGQITEVLGNPQYKGVDTLSVIRSYDLFEEFPYPVEREAMMMPKNVETSKYSKRKIFEHNIVTIDGADAKDFDDAISISRNGDGYELYVHIADVAEYVLEGGEIDKEAYKRGTSVYFPDRVLPMLPVGLSNGICSLNPNEYRLALSTKLNYDKDANLIKGDIFECIIKSSFRMTYTSVTKIFEGDEEERTKYKTIISDLEAMKELSEKLAKKRTQRGAIDFDIPEVQIDVDNMGKTVGLYKRPREISHRLIESFMLAANEFVAKKFFDLEVPMEYRVHESPDMMKVQMFSEFASGFGEAFKVKDELKSKDLQKFLDTIDGKPYADALNKLALRTMQKAKYSDMCMGHYGLAAPFYCHFTSPIRRYPDLLCHRIIKLYLNDLLNENRKREFEEIVEKASEENSIRERLADEAEREVDEMKKAEYMQQFIGQEFDGVISGVQNFGIFITLENTVEGLLRIDLLPKENFEFVERKFMLKGETMTYRLGDKIKVKLIGSDPASKNIDFALPGSKVRLTLPGEKREDRSHTPKTANQNKPRKSIEKIKIDNKGNAVGQFSFNGQFDKAKNSGVKKSFNKSNNYRQNDRKANGGNENGKSNGFEKYMPNKKREK